MEPNYSYRLHVPNGWSGMPERDEIEYLPSCLELAIIDKIQMLCDIILGKRCEDNEQNHSPSILDRN